IGNAVAEAEQKGIKGKESTPFLLAKVKEITGGESLESNIALIYNNAMVGSQLAVELAKLERQCGL
ncbi:MAG TPA: pseudouridine-5-phosphate glycosidase, partial [Clostridiaceae bacterium]|nr:pseudouridine-5-phosphate glycosidase [Clostridiaceae bacterium]